MLKLCFSGNDIAAINGSILAYAATLSAGNSAAPIPISNGTPAAPASSPSAPSSPAATPNASGETDAAGVVFDPARHTGTKVKSGLWRLKTGLSRPENEGENSPNYVNPNGGNSSAAPSAPGAPSVPTPPTPVAVAPAIDPNRPTAEGHTHDNGDGTEQWWNGSAWDGGKHPIPGSAPAAVEEDDEFAAFRAAAGSTPAARTWADADLAKLCNQAAVATNDPEKVKAIIAKYVPAGGVPHSRNIPADQRENFARDVETSFSIQYAA